MGIRHSDVGKVAGDIAGRQIERPTQPDPEMGEVPTHTDAPFEHACGGVGRRPTGVVEFDLLVDPVADGLDLRPPWFDRAELGPGNVDETVRLAIAAGQQELQTRIRKLFQCVCFRRIERQIRHTLDVDERAEPDVNSPGTCRDPAEFSPGDRTRSDNQPLSPLGKRSPRMIATRHRRTTMSVGCELHRQTVPPEPSCTMVAFATLSSEVESHAVPTDGSMDAVRSTVPNRSPSWRRHSAADVAE